MAMTKYPWLPPGTTCEQAEAEALRLCRERHQRNGNRRNCVTAAWVDDAYINELRKHPYRSRQAGATWIDDASIARNVMFYRVVVVQRMRRPGEVN
jgi:hypothetical protein